MAPTPQRDEEIDTDLEASEESPLVSEDAPPLQTTDTFWMNQIMPRISDEDFRRMQSAAEADERPWPSTFQRSIGIISSPMINSTQADVLTKSPKPGGSLFLARLQRKVS